MNKYSASSNDIIGHEDVVKRLNSVLKTGVPHHAYLFVGPEHVGKTTVAKAFAMALVRNASELCMPLQHADISFISPEQIKTKNGTVRTKDIDVETIRGVIQKATRSPLTGKRRVMIVTAADRMTVAAQNALLKTLEEASPTTIVILIAVQDGRLLPTIHSRVERYMFTVVERGVIEKLAKQFFGEEEKWRAIIRIAGGRPGLALRCCNDEDLFAWYSEMMNDALRVSALSIAAKIQYASELSQDMVQMRRAIDVWISVWYEQMHMKSGDERIWLAQRIENAQEMLQMMNATNVNVRLLLEDFLFHNGSKKTTV